VFIEGNFFIRTVGETSLLNEEFIGFLPKGVILYEIKWTSNFLERPEHISGNHYANNTFKAQGYYFNLE